MRNRLCRLHQTTSLRTRQPEINSEKTLPWIGQTIINRYFFFLGTQRCPNEFECQIHETFIKELSSAKAWLPATARERSPRSLPNSLGEDHGPDSSESEPSIIKKKVKQHFSHHDSSEDRLLRRNWYTIC